MKREDVPANKITAKREVKLGVIAEAVKNQTPEDAHRIKSRELAKVKVAGKKFTRRGYTITLLGNPVFKDDLLEVSISVTKDGQPLTVDNPLQYVNPPVLVPDGTYFDDGEKILPNYKEDAQEALKEIITQTVELTAK